MNKTVVAHAARASTFPDTHMWLDLVALADVEISSEQPSHPFEGCLNLNSSGWRASTAGPQTIRLVFHDPQVIRLIHIEFTETVERNQEFWIVAHFFGAPSREVIRQQWSFSPGGASTEIEEYVVDLQNVSILELTIDPGRHDKRRIASLDFIALA